MIRGCIPSNGGRSAELSDLENSTSCVRLTFPAPTLHRLGCEGSAVQICPSRPLSEIISGLPVIRSRRHKLMARSYFFNSAGQFVTKWSGA